MTTTAPAAAPAAPAGPHKLQNTWVFWEHKQCQTSVRLFVFVSCLYV